MLVYLFLALGLIFLIKGADLLVDGASSLAKKLNISALFVGLTIVAFGTSAPELVITIISVFKGSTDLALGNIIGSNIANILLIGGLAAMIYPISVQKGTAKKEIPLSIGALLILLFLANDFFINHTGDLMISRIDGLFLIACFFIFIYYTFGLAKSKQKDDQTEEKINLIAWPIAVIYLIIGIAGLIIGGRWVVNGAVEIARFLGFSQSLIGLTIIAIGTSLPELATSAVAAFKKNADLAIGNIIGSSIFNIFGILGIGALIKPIYFNNILNTDILIGLSATVLLFWFVLTGKKIRAVERWEGLGLFCGYLVYLAFLILRGWYVIPDFRFKITD